MNVRDSEIIGGLLIKQGCKLIGDPQKADIVLFNTCSVRQHAENKVFSEVGKFKNSKIIGIVGCMAQNYKQEIFKRAPKIDFVVGPRDIHKIPEIITRLTMTQANKVSSKDLFKTRIWETGGTMRPEQIYHRGFYNDKSHAYVVISEGCSNFCTYCIVPYVRGGLRNRNHQDILKEIILAIENGIKSITLLGQNVNSYRSGKIDFVKLLELVNNIEGLKEFSFITSHPKDANLSIFRAMRDLKKLKKYLHLPLQSGSNRILKLMKRGYSSKDYLGLINKYRKIVKNGLLTTDIIVGFPSETEGDFQKTYNLMKQVEFNAAYIFKYSPRPHTLADQYPDDVSREEKKRRHKTILDLQKKISRRLKNRYEIKQT